MKKVIRDIWCYVERCGAYSRCLNHTVRMPPPSPVHATACSFSIHSVRTHGWPRCGWGLTSLAKARKSEDYRRISKKHRWAWQLLQGILGSIPHPKTPVSKQGERERNTCILIQSTHCVCRQEEEKILNSMRSLSQGQRQQAKLIGFLYSNKYSSSL